VLGSVHARSSAAVSLVQSQLFPNKLAISPYSIASKRSVSTIKFLTSGRAAGSTTVDKDKIASAYVNAPRENMLSSVQRKAESFKGNADIIETLMYTSTE